MTPDLKTSFLINGDGSSIIPAKISATTNDFTASAKFAIINGQVHIFGGKTDKKKVNLQTNQ